jgi:hypothetical protein
MVGQTMSVDFPTTPGAYDTSFNGGLVDCFVSCLNADGSALLYSSFLGGVSDDWAICLAVDDSGTITMAGQTSSVNFPVTPGAFDTSYNGAGVFAYGDAFVTRLNSTASALIWSTFVGAGDDEYVIATFLQASGGVIFSGATLSSNFPTTASAYDTSFNGGGTSGFGDGYIACLNSTGSALVWSTFLGGSGDEEAMITGVNGTGEITVTDFTTSPDFPVTPGAYDTSFNGGGYYGDAYVARLNSNGSALIWSTFIGGASDDGVNSACLLASGDITLAGFTSSSDFPVTAAAYDTTYNGGSYDGYVARLNSNGSVLAYSSYFGGLFSDAVCGMVLDGSGIATLAGFTNSFNFPVTPGAYDTTFNGGTTGLDVFVSQFDPVPTGIAERNQPVSSPGSRVSLGLPFPNPCQGRFSYNVNLTQTTHVCVKVCDTSGRRVETLVDRQLGAGMHEFNWKPLKELSSGVYYLQLDADNVQQTRKFVIVK